MRTRSSARLFLLTLVLVGCDLFGPGYHEIREVTVGPTLAKCYGVGLQSCMVVDGKFFYGRIGGFEYEAGYDYRLRIGKFHPWGGPEPPQDAGHYAYRLLEQLEKTPAPSTPATLSVGPTRVTCVRSDDFCLVADGTPYEDMITSFEYEAGDHYILEADQYDDGRYVLSEVVSRTRAAGTEEEISRRSPSGYSATMAIPVTARSSTAPPSEARSWAFSPGTTMATACASRGSACFPTV